MENKKKLALISVSDKTKIEVISNFLIKNDFEIISTGGTLKALWDMKIPAKSVEEVTKFPEIMDGRVKTLHPNIHAGILARNKDLDKKIDEAEQQAGKSWAKLESHRIHIDILVFFADVWHIM